jgi:hypothetical protein
VGGLVGLHAAYFPYAFEGIFGLSYVFESVPVLCLLAAAACVLFTQRWRMLGKWVRIGWLILFLGCGLLSPFAQFLERGPNGWISQVLFARGYYAAWETRMRQAGVQSPALVFVQSDPEDVHLDLVTNSPGISDPILRVRDLGPQRNLGLAAFYPERRVWILNAKQRRVWGGWSLDEYREFVSRQGAED